MNYPRSTRFPPFSRSVVILALIALGAVGISLAGAGQTRTYAPLALSGTFTPAETAYLDYVSPRLEELVDEMTAVTALVNAKSRNVIALNSHGNRIEAISGEITDWGDRNGIPPRFAPIDAQIRHGSEIALDTMSRARKALLTLDFAAIPNLIPEFDEGGADLNAALSAMRAQTGMDNPDGVKLLTRLAGA